VFILRIDGNPKCFKFMRLILFSASFGTIRLYLDWLKISFEPVITKKFYVNPGILRKPDSKKQREVQFKCEMFST
jgi:hypothetical protein